MSFGEKAGFLLLPERTSAGWLDCHYDLRRSSGRKRCVTYRKLVWCLVIGALIVLWIFIGITTLEKSTPSLWQHFILTLVLCKLIFFDGGTALAIGEEAMSFGAAVELLLQCHCPAAADQ